MSLVRQFWIALVSMMIAAFGAAMVVSILSARQYLEQQLRVKNIDNATSLALSMSQIDKDPVTLELLVSAQFDAGHYQYIRVVSPSGEMLINKAFTGSVDMAPAWFVKLFPISAEPGQALIQDNWKQYGTLSLASQEQYAYQSLWEGTVELFWWFVGGVIVAGGLGTLMIRLITRPLADLVRQAKGLTERRFITVPEPRTPELNSLARAMNAMVTRLKAMFAEEAERLEALRLKVNHDALTGLAAREYFLGHLRETLTGEEFGSAGVMAVVRVPELKELNNRLGRPRADSMLKEIATILRQIVDAPSGDRVGRINGSEFALVCPGRDSAEDVAQAVHAGLLAGLGDEWRRDVPDVFHVAAVRYHRDQSIGALLTQADEAMARAIGKGPNEWFASDAEGSRLSMPADRWRTVLTEAVQGGRLALSFFPVKSRDGSVVLHSEGFARLQLDGRSEMVTAGDFMLMAAHLNLTTPIDLQIVRLAVEHLRTVPGDVAVNLSTRTIADFPFRTALVRMLKDYPDVCRRLSFEVPEHGVFRDFDAFCDLSQGLKRLGAKVGIEFFGQRFAQSEQLAALGLDYIKVHPTYVRGIRDNPGNQEFLRGLCRMAHALGIVVVAQGVDSMDDLPLLTELGFDGVTGSGVA